MAGLSSWETSEAINDKAENISTAETKAQVGLDYKIYSFLSPYILSYQLSQLPRQTIRGDGLRTSKLENAT